MKTNNANVIHSCIWGFVFVVLSLVIANAVIEVDHDDNERTVRVTQINKEK